MLWPSSFTIVDVLKICTHCVALFIRKAIRFKHASFTCYNCHAWPAELGQLHSSKGTSIQQESEFGTWIIESFSAELGCTVHFQIFSFLWFVILFCLSTLFIVHFFSSVLAFVVLYVSTLWCLFLWILLFSSFFCHLTLFTFSRFISYLLPIFYLYFTCRLLLLFLAFSPISLLLFSFTLLSVVSLFVSLSSSVSFNVSVLFLIVSFFHSSHSVSSFSLSPFVSLIGFNHDSFTHFHPTSFFFSLHQEMPECCSDMKC